MKTNAALCVTLMGGLTVLQGLEVFGARLPKRAGAACAALVVAIAGATLLQHLAGVDLGIDELLLRERAGAVATQSPNRMGPVGSLCLTLLALWTCASPRCASAM